MGEVNLSELPVLDFDPAEFQFAELPEGDDIAHDSKIEDNGDPNPQVSRSQRL